MWERSKDEILDSFMVITGCSREHARRYLQAVDWNEETAVDIFLDSSSSEQGNVPSSVTTRPTNTRAQPKDTGVRPSPESNPYESDDDLLQQALSESLRINQTEQPPLASSHKSNQHRSTISSKVNTFDALRRNEDDSDDEGQTYYAGGSDRSGQQIIGPPKDRDNNKRVANVFDAARRQGATEAHDDEPASRAPQARREKPFIGAGHTLNSENAPSRPAGSQPPSRPAAQVADHRVESIPIRFYSNGFTVGDGELRRFEENREFIECIKRSELPPELRRVNTNGQQVQVRLEDHSSEEYKRVAPTFKSFSGVGHTIGLPGAGQSPSRSTQASSNTPIPDSLDTQRLEEIAKKWLRTSIASSTTIRLRLPDVSTPLSIAIDLNRTLADIRKFLNENIPSLQANTFEFMQPPSTRISRDDEKRKIKDAHLSNSTLVVRRIA